MLDGDKLTISQRNQNVLGLWPTSRVVRARSQIAFDVASSMNIETPNALMPDTCTCFPSPTYFAAALALSLMAPWAEAKAEAHIDQSDPVRFVYGLYGCGETSCGPKILDVKWETYSSSDLREYSRR